MPIPILMPALSPTMEEGKLAKWLVKEGDQVSSGDVIAEIETDKAVMEVEAVDEGRIGKIIINEGTEGVAVNSTIALLLEEDEDQNALKNSDIGNGGVASSNDKKSQELPNVEKTVESKTASDSPPAKPPSQAANGKDERIFASPLARRLAADNNIQLDSIKGSGPHGRIIKRDIVQAINTGIPVSPTTALAKTSQPPPIARSVGMTDDQILALFDQGSYEIIPHDNMRRTIANRLVESKLTIPHFYLSIDCELDALLASRQRMNESAPKDGPKAFKLSVNDFIIKAMAMALQQVPEANVVWTEQGILRQQSSDIGVAVALEGGLFTPIVRHAELKSLSEISNEMQDLATRARNRRLAPHEYQGGTTSISNLGMYGITKFDAVINPPHSSILAVGQGERRPVVKGEVIEVVTQMSVALSCDHRAVDGALGAKLLAAFKRFIEDPVTMLL